MKKLTAALCAVLLVLCVCLPGASAAGPALSATRAYCIVDADTGLVLAQQNMNEELHPASITKVMTLGLACEKAQGNWDNVKLTVTHEDVYSLAGTDSSHIALREGEEVPLVDALYATQMASANDGANLLAEYFGGGTIEGGVAKMNEQVEELGLAHTHFANPHGISDEDHYTSCYDMAQILRWALEQPGFEDVFTRSEMYTMQPTNVQPVTRYFSQQDKMRIGSSRYHIASILGSKIGYTNTARYSYACLAEQNGVRLICVTMQSELSTDKYNDVRTLLDYAFSTFTNDVELPGDRPAAGDRRRREPWHGHCLRPRCAAAAGRRLVRKRCDRLAGTARDVCAGHRAGGVRGVCHPGRHKAGEHQRAGKSGNFRPDRAAGKQHRHRAGSRQSRAAQGPGALAAGHLAGVHRGSGGRDLFHRAAAGKAQKTPRPQCIPPWQISAKACTKPDFSR